MLCASSRSSSTLYFADGDALEDGATAFVIPAATPSEGTVLAEVARVPLVCFCAFFACLASFAIFFCCVRVIDAAAAGAEEAPVAASDTPAPSSSSPSETSL